LKYTLILDRILSSFIDLLASLFAKLNSLGYPM